MNHEIELIRLYLFLDEEYHSHLWPLCQRLTKNQQSPKFSDVEVLTVYIFGILMGHKQLNHIYLLAESMLKAWFPNLVSYPSFNRRLNRLHSIFPVLIERLQERIFRSQHPSSDLIVDSFPVAIANSKRSGFAKVAPHFADKGICATKSGYYYGVKVHIIACRRPGTIPVPNYIGLSPASHNDLTVLKYILPQLKNASLFGDKIYRSKPLREQLFKEQCLQLFTPVKKKKKQATDLTMFQKLFSTSVSRVRQPIESLFNWIHEKTGIENASKVRSKRGILVHTFGKLAVAMYIMAFSM
jgi:hypothetical protein